MGFKEALHTTQPAQPRVVDRYLQSMDDSKRADAEALLRSDHPSRYVAEVFTEEGYPLSRSPICDWRRANDVR